MDYEKRLTGWVKNLPPNDVEFPTPCKFQAALSPPFAPACAPIFPIVRMLYKPEIVAIQNACGCMTYPYLLLKN